MIKNVFKRAAIVSLVVVLCFGSACGKAKKTSKKATNEKETTQAQTKAEVETTTAAPKDTKVDIIDINSKTRPYAVSINNTPVAVQVQTGLNRAYLIYEIPTEGYTCRMLALFKLTDKDGTDKASEDIVGSGNVATNDVVIGTVRSARHNFLDFCFESDAIFTHFGGSTWAESDEAKTGINWINGYYENSYFWRSNPEDLASEHTAYTSFYRLKEATADKSFRTEAESAADTQVLKYNIGDIDLSTKEGAVACNSVTVPYSSYQYTTFKYDATTGNYLRFASGDPSLDHETKEQFNTKNIIVQRITHGMMPDDYCWDLNTVGSGDGYYITNGYAVPIKWSKDSRTSKTKYTYLDGTEIEVSDGRTYIEVSDMNNDYTIE